MNNLAELPERRDIIEAPSNVVGASADSLMAVISRAASDPSVDVNKLERLMSLYERVSERTAKAAYSAALAEMQPDLPSIERNGKITILDKVTKSVIQSTDYARWEDINDAVKPILGRHGFALSFRTGLAGDGKLTVTGILSHKDGHQEETTMSLPHDSTGSKNAVQAVGSSTSYGKRYVAMALLNLTSRAPQDRDDDGKAAGGGFISEEQERELQELLISTGSDPQKFLAFAKIEKLGDMQASRFDDAVKLIKQTAARRAK